MQLIYSDSKKRSVTAWTLGGTKLRKRGKGNSEAGGNEILACLSS